MFSQYPILWNLTPDADVMAAAQQFQLAWVERNLTFRWVIIAAERTGGNWNLQSRYEYDD